MEDPLLETWAINGRVVLYVLDAAAEAGLTGSGATRGRSVSEMFAHIHNVRLMWLQSAAPDLSGNLAKLEKGAAGDKATLARALTDSASAIGQMQSRALPSGKVKGFKPHAAAFVGYLISHEGYHLGEIAVALQQSGHPLDRRTAFGMWEWGVR